MTLISKLKNLGYELCIDGEKLKYRYTLPGDPPADKVKPLLDELREHKAEVIAQLKFKMDFDGLTGYLRQRNYTPENIGGRGSAAPRSLTTC